MERWPLWGSRGVNMTDFFREYNMFCAKFMLKNYIEIKYTKNLNNVLNRLAQKSSSKFFLQRITCELEFFFMFSLDLIASSDVILARAVWV